jgi:hypothetical protein
MLKEPFYRLHPSNGAEAGRTPRRCSRCCRVRTRPGRALLCDRGALPEDLAFAAISENLVPPVSAIVFLRAENNETIKAVFVKMLKLCEAAGLALAGTIEINGTTLGSDERVRRTATSIGGRRDRQDPRRRRIDRHRRHRGIAHLHPGRAAAAPGSASLASPALARPRPKSPLLSRRHHRRLWPTSQPSGS